MYSATIKKNFTFVFLVIFIASSSHAARGRKSRDWAANNYQTQQQQAHNYKRKPARTGHSETNLLFNQLTCKNAAGVAVLALTVSLVYWSLAPDTTQMPGAIPKKTVRLNRQLPAPYGVAQLSEVPCVKYQKLTPKGEIFSFVQGFVHPGIYSGKIKSLKGGMESLMSDCYEKNFMKANENGDILCFPSQEYKRTWEFDAPQEESSVFDRELSDLAWNFILEEFFSLENNPIDKLLAEGAADFEKNIKFIHTYFLGQGYLSEFRNFKDGTEIIRLNFEFPSKYGEWESYLKAHQPENLQSFYNFMKTVDNIVAEMKKAYPQVTQKNLKDIEKLSIEEKIGLSFELVMMSNRSHEFDFLKKNFFYIPTLSQEDFSKKISKLRKKVLTKLKQDPIHAAAYFHVEFVNLHPFKDGNGRTARAIMNIILMGSGIDAVAFPSNREYMEACFAASEQKSEVAFENFLRKIILEQKENANELEQVSQVLERCEDQCQEMIDDKILF